MIPLELLEPKKVGACGRVVEWCTGSGPVAGSLLGFWKLIHCGLGINLIELNELIKFCYDINSEFNS